MHSRLIGVRCVACALTGVSLSSIATAEPTAQSTPLPAIEVTTSQQKKAASKKAAPKDTKPQAAAQPKAVATPVPQPSPTPQLTGSPLERSGALTSPSTAEARAEIERTPGAVEVVSDKAYKVSTPAATIKDALDYVPGVFAQPKWGDDTRLSIRGSGLSRNFHLRGIQLYMDGIPINTADGYGDFQEIDPTAYRYIEVFKGANALRFGANALGGAINFVVPTGYDANLFGARLDLGSFGFRKASVNSGGVYGATDYFVNVTAQEADGFRAHSDGESLRGSMNLGYRLNENVETRFYLNANTVDQRIPGSVTKQSALSNPQAAAAGNLTGDQQRNIDSLRIANKTAIRLSDTTLLEVGAFNTDRHLMHPIFQWLDYQYDDYGGFARLTDERRLGTFKNRLIAGVNLHYGTIDTKQYANVAGGKGALLFDSDDRAGNAAAYIENSFYFLPAVALVTGTQFLNATRDRNDNLLGNGDQSGETEFNLWSPKAGLLWDIDPAWQAFTNISRSAELPSFGESVFVPGVTIPFTDIRPQRATTYEIGTRGQRQDYSWDVTLYRAEIEDELLCFYSAFGNCNVSNAGKTVHQGVEVGLGAAIMKSMFVSGASPDRLWSQTAYTFNDFYFDNDKDFGDNQLPGAPRHFVRAELLYKHPSGIYFGPNVEWVPEAYYVDSANTVKTEPYALLGAKIGYDAGGPITAYIEARNLTDEIYIASASIIDRANPASDRLFEPGTGRAVYGGVSVKW